VARTARPPRFGHAEVYALVALLSFLAARFLPLLGLPFVCPVRALAGIPCATCGMTHAFVALAHGDLGAALAASPLGAALAAGAWTYALLDAVRVAAGVPWPAPSPRAARAAALALLAAVVVNWAFMVAREVGS
jgi:hypothetical protein